MKTKKNSKVNSKMKFKPVRSVKQMPEYKDKKNRETVLYWVVILFAFLTFILWVALGAPIA